VVERILARLRPTILQAQLLQLLQRPPRLECTPMALHPQTNINSMARTNSTVLNTNLTRLSHTDRSSSSRVLISLSTRISNSLAETSSMVVSNTLGQANSTARISNSQVRMALMEVTSSSPARTSSMEATLLLVGALMVLRTIRSLLRPRGALLSMDKMHNRDNNISLHPLDNSHTSRLLVQAILMFKRTAASLAVRLINMLSSHKVIAHHRQAQAVRISLLLHLEPLPEDITIPITQARGASNLTVASRNSTVALLLYPMVPTLSMEELTERLH
jgi:hypothetical protein